MTCEKMEDHIEKKNGHWNLIKWKKKKKKKNFFFQIIFDFLNEQNKNDN